MAYDWKYDQTTEAYKKNDIPTKKAIAHSDCICLRTVECIFSTSPPLLFVHSTIHDLFFSTLISLISFSLSLCLRQSMCISLSLLTVIAKRIVASYYTPFVVDFFPVASYICCCWLCVLFSSRFHLCLNVIFSMNFVTRKKVK